MDLLLQLYEANIYKLIPSSIRIYFPFNENRYFQIS